MTVRGLNGLGKFCSSENSFDFPEGSSATSDTPPEIDRTCQLEPPLVVCSSVALIPTATPLFPSQKETLYNDAVVPEDCVDQLEPPFAVWMIVPPVPTAHPLLLSTKLTELRFALVPLVWPVQLAPPSPV